jgi:DNA-binding transcriptional LysR family regulator
VLGHTQERRHAVECGERFLSRAKLAFEELIAACEVAREVGQRTTGLLRLSVPRGVVPLILEPVIASFCQAYPEIELEIAASDEMVDLAVGGFDAGIRLGQFIEPNMTAVRLTPRMRRSNGSIAPWPFVDGNKAVAAIVSGPLIAHDFPTLIGAAIKGVGLAQVPGPLTAAPIADGRLQAVLTRLPR